MPRTYINKGVEQQKHSSVGKGVNCFNVVTEAGLVRHRVASVEGEIWTASRNGDTEETDTLLSLFLGPQL